MLVGVVGVRLPSGCGHGGGKAALCLWTWWGRGCPVLVGMVGARLPCACGHGGGKATLCLWMCPVLVGVVGTRLPCACGHGGGEAALCLWAWWERGCPVLVGRSSLAEAMITYTPKRSNPKLLLLFSMLVGGELALTP